VSPLPPPLEAVFEIFQQHVGRFLPPFATLCYYEAMLLCTFRGLERTSAFAAKLRFSLHVHAAMLAWEINIAYKGLPHGTRTVFAFLFRRSLVRTRAVTALLFFKSKFLLTRTNALLPLKLYSYRARVTSGAFGVYRKFG